MMLAVLMLLPAAACSARENDGPSGETAGGDTTAQTVPDGIEYEEDGLPELDFRGKTVNVLYSHNSTLPADFSVEELTSDPVNDSIYNRELFVEERLGVDIRTIIPDDFTREVNKQASAQEDTFQIYGNITFRFADLVFTGNLIDLYGVDYLDFEKPWWSGKFIDSAETFGEIRMATGVITTSLLRSLFAVFYNKKLAQDYVRSYPDLANLYELVESGEWTFDRFSELGSGIYIDLNGNSEKDIEDFYGIGLKRSIQMDPLFSAFDITVLGRSDDGWFEYNENTEKLLDALEKMHATIYETGGVFSETEAADIGYIVDERYDDKFADGSFLFNVNRLASAESVSLRNMTDDYGVLPFPKYDRAQKEYYSHAHDQYVSFGIPATNPDPDAAAAVLEAMASYSYRETGPVYLDMVLKGRYMSDQKSRKMIDIIVDGFKLDPAWIYISSVSDRFTNDVRDLLINGQTTYSSFFESARRKVNQKIKFYRSLYDTYNS